ncbi:hypothetical protein VTL71DRAFT_11372 [Oculimacula yallundae]|uniref:Uncharacterized protein n=1 Tax=Oculimacula yallundae TaxID=86028 RepID=A0ABR4CQC1_9HELO
MLKPHPQPNTSHPPSHFLQPTTAATTNSSPSKRKRGLPAISTIPPTPPRSSPAPDYIPDTNNSSNNDSEDDMRLNINIPGAPIIRHEIATGEGREEGASSPRTKVAYNFQGLKLEDAGAGLRRGFGGLDLDGPAVRKERSFGGNEMGVDGAFDEGDLIPMGGEVDMERIMGDGDGDLDQQVARKRVKVVQQRQKKRVEVPETPQRVGAGNGWGAGMGSGLGRRKDEEKKFGIFIGEERMVDPAIRDAARGVTLSNFVDEMVFMGNGSARIAGDSHQSHSQSHSQSPQPKSRKKRAGTPPLSSLPEGEMSNRQDKEISSLTWHDDEITGHDPTDPDDDGEGINGIGFKPTAAEAYARTQKRRQQMAEYRNREARDARKMRSERRRGSELSKASKEEQETARRVRFLEQETKAESFLET